MQAAFASDAYKQLRTALLNGEQPDICSVCWNKEKLGLTSYRQVYNNDIKYQDLIDIDNPELKYIDIKFDNNCNLQCSYCDIGSSNQFERARKYFDRHNISYPNNLIATENYYSDEKEQSIKQIAHSLKILKVTGGEPLLSKQFVRTVDYLIEQGFAKNIDLKITTNATVFNREFLNKLSEFKQVRITISVDAVGKLYDYIRWPYNFNMFQQRIDELFEYILANDYAHNKKFKVNFAAVLNIYNVLNIVEAVTWFHSLPTRYNIGEYYFNNHYDFNPSIHPSNHPLSIYTLPQEILNEAAGRVDSIKHANNMLPVVNEIYSKLKHNPNITPSTSLKTFTEKYDMQKGTDYKTILDPIIVEHINRS
jgi:organic radical activating enzyme